VSQLVTSQGWQDYLRVQARFHHYSANNVLLILIQKPDASRVAGFQQWKQLGRYVKRGESGIAIFAPITHKLKVTTTDDDDETASFIKLVGFKIVHVFDVGQTDGKPLPEVPIRKLDSAGTEALMQTMLGIADKLKLYINSIGCPDCRRTYHEKLRAYFEQHKGELCETCGGRLEKNPMRIFDCKSPVCAQIAKDAPLMLDSLCDDCRAHFERLQQILNQSRIAYEINPRIVRGLDYYTKTVFEFVAEGIGAQDTVCGGGRYDGLVNMLGGVQLSGLGFGMGLERLLIMLEAAGYPFVEPAKPDVCAMTSRRASRAVRPAIRRRCRQRISRPAPRWLPGSARAGSAR
jgi:hypothetical protein